MKSLVIAALMFLQLALGAAGAFASDRNTATARAQASAPVTVNASDSNRALGLGSASPSANACQRVILFAFSFDVESCMLQQWAFVLGREPTAMQLQIACQDALLADLPFCAKYRRPSEK